jgi:hypothetical protein
LNVIVPLALLVPPESVAVSVRSTVPSGPMSNGPPALVDSEVWSELTTGFSPSSRHAVVAGLLLLSPL